MKFIQKHKRLLIIVLIALIIIGVAYYFTLGKPTGQTSTSTSSGGSSTGGSGSTPLPATSSGSLGSYPLKWGVYNAFTKVLQARLNLSITTCKLGSTIAEDGILGNQTVAAIKQSFPSIGASVETNRYVTEGQYSIIINSKPGCV